MNTRRPSLSRTRAFSLVEMLIVISVIGVITAIAVEFVPNINEAAHNAKAKRNAQGLASVFSSAQAAGLDFYNADLATVISDLVDGGTVNESGNPFDGTSFSVPGLSLEEQGQAQAFLVLDTNSRTLTYNLYAP